MKEIGSEFWEVPTKASLSKFPYNAKWFISGRSALYYIITDMKSKRKINKVAMPSWCCDSMIKPFVDSGIDVKFYPIYLDDDGHFMQDLSDLMDCAAVLVMDYFGYTGQNNVYDFSGIIIRDVTHSIFSANYEDADYYFGSLRKWAGFWSGGYAWAKDISLLTAPIPTPNKHYAILREKAMQEKGKYIREFHDNKEYLSMFSEAEKLLDICGICGAEDRDIALLQKLDVEFIRTRRRENAKRLLNSVADIAIFPELQASDCPLFVPIMVPKGKRDALRSYLIQNDIFCPVHWPISMLHRLDEHTQRIYDEEISIVCDQRYSVYDMQRVCAFIEDFRTREMF